MSKTTWIALLSMAVVPTFAFADDWKDESGRLKHYYERTWGEPLEEKPAWARGRGYWDGNYGLTPPWHRPYQLPEGYYRSYAPAPNWRGDRDGSFDRREDFKNRMQDRRERFKERRTEQLERQNQARERQLKPYGYLR